MRKARYVYRYQQALNKFHITKEVWALQLAYAGCLTGGSKDDDRVA
jgi:hypothetical protein